MWNRIRDERLGRGWTITYLAGKADVTRQTIHTLENDPHYTPRGAIMVRIAAAFGCNLSDIFLTETAPTAGA